MSNEWRLLAKWVAERKERKTEVPDDDGGGKKKEVEGRKFLVLSINKAVEDVCREEEVG